MARSDHFRSSNSRSGPSLIGAVRDEVNFDFSFQDAIARDYANLSGLARVIRPKVAARMGKKVKDVNEEGIISSLKRIRDDYAPGSSQVASVVGNSVVNVRTGVSRLSVEKTRKTLQTVSTLLSSYQEDFMQVSESLSSITLIFDERLHKEVRKALATAELLDEGEERAAITVHSPKEIITTTGCISSFYDQLSRKHVNIEDTVS
ncbi:MAG: hypothetical protein E6K86_11320, partial [Thaumarchaeota archaeon]